VSDFPAHWVPATLADVGRWGSGGTPKTGESSYYDGNIPWIRSGDLPDGLIREHPANISETGLANSSAKWVPERALLIALYGATIGKLGITAYPVTTNQAVAFCVPLVPN
jgi:type I restriction enzyme S subunit